MGADPDCGPSIVTSTVEQLHYEPWQMPTAEQELHKLDHINNLRDINGLDQDTQWKDLTFLSPRLLCSWDWKTSPVLPSWFLKAAGTTKGSSVVRWNLAQGDKMSD